MQLKHSSSPSTPLPLRVITHNIRYLTNPDQRFDQEPPWSERLPLLSSQFLFHSRLRYNPPHTVIFLQECLTQQLHDLHAALGADDWEYRGVGRDDGEDQGERCVVLFRKSYWKLLNFDTTWLNESALEDGHGEVGKKGWDAASVRVVTSCVLRSRHQELVEDHEVMSLKNVLFMNTHLDDQGVLARKNSAHVINTVAYGLSWKFDLQGCVVGGDLNSEVDGEAYKVLTDKSKYGGGCLDTRSSVSSGDRYGEDNTFTGFDGTGDGEGCKRIDFLFTNQAWNNKVASHAVLPNAFEDGIRGRASDHRAVLADFLI